MDPSVEKLLSSGFGEGMKEILGPDYPSFLASFEGERSRALRLHPRKLSEASLGQLFDVQALPWIKGGFEIRGEERPSQSPLYRAGAFYLQDAGAMTPASRLPIEPGDKVLDLCAAPGGKATAAGAALQGEGILLANDISPTRARALLRNLELFGITNALVTSEDPKDLAERFPSFFDKVILDAPCSGEGMFRKDPSLAADWTREKSQALSRLQRVLLSVGYSMLRPGGLLLYSTCTYEPAEDEEVLSSLLSAEPSAEVVPVEPYEGFAPGVGLPACVRIYPHRMRAEGHFFALIRKNGEAPEEKKARPRRKPSRPKELAPLEAFLAELGIERIGGLPFSSEKVFLSGEKAYLLPSLIEPGKKGSAPTLAGVSLGGLSFLRCGLYLGELKKDRFEPSEPLALALLPGEAQRTIDLPASDERLESYLRGEPIYMEGTTPGTHLLTVEKVPLAFTKAVNGTLKNKLPASWRTLS